MEIYSTIKINILNIESYIKILCKLTLKTMILFERLITNTTIDGFINKTISDISISI